MIFDMIDQKKKFYVTTPIYYVTARPHLGSLYSTLLADVAARWHKLKNDKTFFLTGTDEHGQKVAEAAAKAHKSPKEFVDSFIDAYKETWHSYHIAYDHFIRTTDEYHVKAVQEWIRQLQKSGDIYKAFYSGFYCIPCETFVTEKEEAEGQAPACISCQRPTHFVSEESYFFRLSAYQDRLLKFYEEHPDFITPEERLNEVVSFVKGGLKDLSISRTSITWGIPFPDDPKHVVYVWADALNNYITAVGYGNEARKEEFNFWWPADMQVLGKDIVRFHAVYWPAFLMASKLALPKNLLVHGWLKVNSQKMSKSFGNVIDPQDLLAGYGPELIRYYLVRYMAITQDSEFSTGDLEQRITTDLANDLGNLLNRMVALADKRELFEIQPPSTWGAPELALRDSFWNMLELFQIDMDEGYFYRALGSLWKFIHEVNAYFHAQEPWKVKDNARFAEIISATAHSLHAIGILLWPVMPEKMEELLKSVGTPFELKIDLIEELGSNPWTKTFMLNKIGTLFQKYIPQGEVMQPESNQKPEAEKEAGPASIDIQDFTKVMLLVGTIEQCEEVPGSDKLLKLQVNFGSYGMRQVLSGVKKYFTCQDLIGKQGIFVYNLAPRKMMGLESHGMMLFAEDEQQHLKMATVGAPVPNGTRLK
jgi:methionyl-tRNA synthetase